MTIPEVRECLHALADELGCPELHDLAEATRRRYHGRRTRAKAAPMTPELADSIREVAAMRPDLSEIEIGNIHGVNQGRVSEALFGVRL